MQCRFSKARIIDTFFSGLGKSTDRGRNDHGPGTEKWPAERMVSQVPGKSEATEKPLGIPSKTTEIIANHL